MTREIGEIFEFEDKKLQVVECAGISCKGCYFYEHNGSCTPSNTSNFIGQCLADDRKDNKNIIFVEIKSMKQTIEIEVPDGKKAVWEDGKIAFKDIKPQLPKTWKQFCEQNKIKSGECFLDYDCCIIEAKTGNRDKITDRNVLPNKQAAEQHLALMQLHQLRDCYRQGWVPNWNNSFSVKFCIKCLGNVQYGEEDQYGIITSTTEKKFLSFQSSELAKDFIINFEDLIKQAGDLI